MRFKILISNDHNKLRAEKPEVTIEAEFGSELVEGTELTLAHHGPRSHNPCPCLGDNLNLPDRDTPITIGVSHFDLDTLGGVMRVTNKKRNTPKDIQKIFWAVAAQVDVQGVHRINKIVEELLSGDYNHDDINVAIESLHAFWAWSENNRLFPERSGEITDCTNFFENAIDTLNCILDPTSSRHQELIFAGVKWLVEKKALEKESLINNYGSEQYSSLVLLRSSTEFVNHLYDFYIDGNVANGVVANGVVGYNSTRHAITVSTSDPVEGFSCEKFAQDLWGPEAGGRSGIAGSPRGKKMTMEDARRAAISMADRLFRP